MRKITIDEIALADEPGRWEALGFSMSGDTVKLGAVSIRLAGADAGRGIVGWSLRNLAITELDGLPTALSERPPHGAAPEHPNGIVAIDHVVAMSPNSTAP